MEVPFHDAHDPWSTSIPNITELTGFADNFHASEDGVLPLPHQDAFEPSAFFSAFPPSPFSPFSRRASAVTTVSASHTPSSPVPDAAAQQGAKAVQQAVSAAKATRRARSLGRARNIVPDECISDVSTKFGPMMMVGLFGDGDMSEAQGTVASSDVALLIDLAPQETNTLHAQTSNAANSMNSTPHASLNLSPQQPMSLGMSVSTSPKEDSTPAKRGRKRAKKDLMRDECLPQIQTQHVAKDESVPLQTIQVFLRDSLLDDEAAELAPKRALLLSSPCVSAPGSIASVSNATYEQASPVRVESPWSPSTPTTPGTVAASNANSSTQSVLHQTATIRTGPGCINIRILSGSPQMRK